MNSLVAEQFNGNYVQIGTSNRMALSAINDKFDEWWLGVVTRRHNFPSPLDEENLAPWVTTSQIYR